MTAAIGSASAGTNSPEEISGNLPALPLGDARISQHAAANGAHAMSKLEGAPCSIPQNREKVCASDAGRISPTHIWKNVRLEPLRGGIDVVAEIAPSLVALVAALAQRDFRVGGARR